MGKRLYVGNVPYRLTEEELTGFFSQVGQVTEVNIIMDRETGRAKGFAFVEMADDSAALAAVEQLDGQQLGGRTIKVAEAKPRPSGFRDERNAQ